ncbi:cell wall-binding repeat-containing protein [Candidatus Clostridium radicumherbarum]|uniref:Cell wall-binding repeat-containing protein n=1 Tax=Candidatus Clostridium radicumherbarum TaxID=3381662 RepID=A0ABW8TXC9_9CLOT
MGEKSYGVLTTLLVVIILSCVYGHNVYAQTDNDKQIQVTRLAGKDRYETATIISKFGWKQTCDNAILVTGEDYPDALCSVPLAAKLKAPILLTERNNLNSNTLNEIRRLNVKKVFIIGGTGVITEKVEKTIRSLNLETERLAGTDRYETCVKIAEKMGQPTEAFITTGEDFPDALSAAPVASVKNVPILLTSKKIWPASIKAYLNKTNIKNTYVIGGQAVIDNYATTDLLNSIRIYGSDRYETNNKIINKFYESLNLKTIYLATGENFPDALSGAALAQISSSPIVLTPRKANGIVRDLLDSHKFLITNINLLGGEQIVSNDSVSMDPYSQIKNAKVFLNISTYDGSNQSVHPKVLYFSNGWNGWKYWMVYTPYPNGNDMFENPSVTCSNDGVNWIAPKTLINPLVDAPLEKGEHNSDPHLVYNYDTQELELWYRYTYFDNEDRIYRITTKNGSNWTKPELVLTFENQEHCYSPVVLYENKEYKLFYVNEKYEIISKKSIDAKSWYGDTNVNLKMQDPYLPWHLDIVHTDIGYEAVVTAFKDGERRLNNMQLIWAVSEDGINYNNSQTILMPSYSNTAWDNKQIYRSTFVKVDGVYKLFYSAMDKNIKWHIGLSQGYNLQDLCGYSLMNN